MRTLAIKNNLEKSCWFFFYTIVSLIRFPKIQTKQMAPPARTIGANKGPTARLRTMRNASRPPRLRQDLTSISPRASLVYVSGNTSHTRHRSAPTFTQLSFLQISQINRRNYFSWLSTHISLGREQNKQLIFPYLFSPSPCLFQRRLSRLPVAASRQQLGLSGERMDSGLRA